MKVEYKIRTVPRYIVTRWHSDDKAIGGCETKGEFDNPDIAYEVAYALAKDEHARLGLPLESMDIIYPQHPSTEGKVLEEIKL